MNGPEIRWLPDKHRLHFNHGPIDLIVEAFGGTDEVQAAYRQAAERFQTILDELVGELTELRRPASAKARRFQGRTAQRMELAVAPLAQDFITPMAAVAGAVADEMIAAMVLGRSLKRAYINNGGDVALHIDPGERISLAVAGTGHGFADRLTIRYKDPVRGIATSGWRGRSFSLGIADAVTVLAASGAAADAAATLIANAVDVPRHGAIHRKPARELAPDSDLGGRLVTTNVGALSPPDVNAALDSGLKVADTFHRQGLIHSAALFLAGEHRISGTSLAVTPDVSMRGTPIHA